jgi:hypothetical protein
LYYNQDHELLNSFRGGVHKRPLPRLFESNSLQRQSRRRNALPNQFAAQSVPNIHQISEPTNMNHNNQHQSTVEYFYQQQQQQQQQKVTRTESLQRRRSFSNDQMTKISHDYQHQAAEQVKPVERSQNRLVNPIYNTIGNNGYTQTFPKHIQVQFYEEKNTR